MDPATATMANELLKQELTFVYGLFQAAELEARTTERYLLVTLGGMYSYLGTKDIPAHLIRVAWYAPALVTLFAAIRAIGLLSRQIHAFKHLGQFEHQFPLPNRMHIWAQSDGRHFPVLALTAALFYVVLIVGTFVVAYRMT